MTESNWQWMTFLDTLRLLLPASKELPGLEQGIVEFEGQIFLSNSRYSSV
jgi:hypothetical protein